VAFLLSDEAVFINAAVIRSTGASPTSTKPRQRVAATTTKELDDKLSTVGGRPRRDHVSGDRFDLSGRVALITGATRGLGREIAFAFADAGADLVISSRKAEACDEVAQAIRDRGRDAFGHACHIGHWDDVERLVDAAYERFGRVDVLVKNAGVSPLYPAPSEVSEELWDKVLAVNLNGPFRLTALVDTRMAAGDGGSIINVSSIGAVRVTAHPSVRRREGRPQCVDRWLCGCTRTHGPRQLHHGRPVPYRHLEGVGHEASSRNKRPRLRCAAAAGPRRSSGLRCTWRAMLRASRPARCWRLTAERCARCAESSAARSFGLAIRCVCVCS
jgi:NAD(P)-dependent dehydrogenase (short-subunit alcohol dehydrogenase family)